MNLSHRQSPPLRPLAIASAVLWGALELVALWRARWVRRSR